MTHQATIYALIKIDSYHQYDHNQYAIKNDITSQCLSSRKLCDTGITLLDYTMICK